MALLNKLFFPSATSVPTASSSLNLPTNSWTSTSSATSGGLSGSSYDNKSHKNHSVHSKNYLNQFPFDGHQVRILLYRESDTNGRRLLFDSSALQKVSLPDASGKPLKGETAKGVQQTGNQNQNNKESLHFLKQRRSSKHQHSSDFIKVCNEYGFKHNRPNSADITSIGEMVFGALAMSFRGTALKVHWLGEPARILCSQVFFTPVSSAYNHSPYSTISLNTLSTPRTSICSEHGSIDGVSMASFSMPFSVNVDRHMSLPQSERGPMLTPTCPMDVPEQMSLSINSDSGPRCSSTYSTATDSGYSTSRGGHMSSDQWSASYQYSTRSSLGSVMSEHVDAINKCGTYPTFYAMEKTGGCNDATSDGCLKRRIFRNLFTSFENEQSMNDLIGFISDTFPVTNGGGSEGGYMGVPNYRRSSYSTNETRSNPEMGKRRDTNGLKSTGRRVKLGLAVCITMSESFEEEMELFCSEHISLLESMISRLRARTEQAYLNHNDFLKILYQAWQETQQWFTDLFTAPRIKCPVWLSITTSGSKYSKNVAERFMKELCDLLSYADTKDTNFFISTLLTAVLTHHLGWVTTVSSSGCSSSSRSEKAAAAIEQRQRLLQVSQKHPYNALWAQMGDLFGAIGVPVKLTRTVVHGSEKLLIERILNVLTYFIRCGEVRRSTKREDFNKDLVISLATQRDNISKNFLNAMHKGHTSSGLSLEKCSNKVGGLVRNQSYKGNLNNMSDKCDIIRDSSLSALEENGVNLVRTLKRNEIPTVLAFRDSRFVQQELRIGNYLMDTGIEKKSVQVKQPSISSSMKDFGIRLTITTPDNIEMCVEDDTDDGVLEAIEIDASDVAKSTNRAYKTVSGGNIGKSFFWNVAPSDVKEGVSLGAIEHLNKSMHLIGKNLGQNQFEYNKQSGSGSNSTQINIEKEQAERRISHLSLSDLITQNSIGKSERMTWGIEPIKENLSLEEQIHFDKCQKVIEREHGISHSISSSEITPDATGEGAVVFVLGDNEPLVNIKRSQEDLTTKGVPEYCNEQQEQHDHRICGRGTNAKKHSGVKFNFEQYPQIVTNYMKGKNLVLCNYDLLKGKWTKFSGQEDSDQVPGITEVNSQSSVEQISYSSCSNLYQTPSNATELEFEADNEHCNLPSTLPKVSSTTSVDTLKCSLGTAETVSSLQSIDKRSSVDSAISGEPHSNRLNISQSSSASLFGGKNGAKKMIHLLKLPVPAIKEVLQENEPYEDMKLRAGFIPSLLLNVSDHYVSDMVLQGTTASPSDWEHSLRESLTLATHSASLLSLPVENMAIVADMEKWDVRLISSQPQRFVNDDSQSAPVGMSQLVSSMLETVHAMHNSGISAYECLSFLESKLQEIYLQSESLAAFLLETDFCQLNAVTTAFNLSENDVPLLWSIASIHTPQISNKYGISFI